MSKKVEPNFENVHWADNSAQRVLEEFPDEKVYTVASGITPSGIIHVGHFREIITSELVRRALENKGKKTKFIYSWDSYDAFRKVPKNLPEEWSEYLRLPDANVPDPWKCHESFAEHYMQTAEESLEVFKFPIEFQRQHQLQTSGAYADGIRKYLRARGDIKKILDKFRSEPLGEKWFPLTVYSEKTGKDTTEILSYDEEYSITYRCKETGFENTIDFRRTPIVKLSWRLDWPMRWNHYKVSFEPGGKDHSTPGGSYDTGKEMVETVDKRKAPVYTFYNFIGMKGTGGKISSSKGEGATISDVLKVYTPELVLYLFASTRPNAEFSISFDMDVIKIYEDFDNLERLYYGLEEEKNPKKLANLKRTYELSMIEGKPQKMIPLQIGFRHLTTIAQANNFDFEKTKAVLRDDLKTKFDEERLKTRFECVKNWLEMFAPDDMKFRLNEKFPEAVRTLIPKEQIEMIKEVRVSLEKAKDEKELFESLREILKRNEMEAKAFFELMYQIAISKSKGPKLAPFMLENKEKILNLLRQV